MTEGSVFQDYNDIKKNRKKVFILNCEIKLAVIE